MSGATVGKVSSASAVVALPAIAALGAVDQGDDDGAEGGALVAGNALPIAGGAIGGGAGKGEAVMALGCWGGSEGDEAGADMVVMAALAAAAGAVGLGGGMTTEGEATRAGSDTIFDAGLGAGLDVPAIVELEAFSALGEALGAVSPSAGCAVVTRWNVGICGRPT